MTIYRVHYTCPAGHRTYQDYKTKRAARRQFDHCGLDGWWVTHIEIINHDPA